MKGIYVQFLILFAVLCAGLHAPALAHGIHDGHGEVIMELTDGHHVHGRDEVPQDSSSHGAQDLPDHHHCPMAMTFETPRSFLNGFVGRDILRPGAAAVLVSRATAPPTEPPLA